MQRKGPAVGHLLKQVSIRQDTDHRWWLQKYSMLNRHEKVQPAIMAIEMRFRIARVVSGKSTMRRIELRFALSPRRDVTIGKETWTTD